MKNIFLIGSIVVSCISILVLLGLHTVNTSDVAKGTYKVDKQWQTKKSFESLNWSFMMNP